MKPMKIMKPEKAHGDEELIKALAVHEILQREADGKLPNNETQEIQEIDKNRSADI